MNNLTKYEDFVVQSVTVLNEASVFDTLKSVFSKIATMFEKPDVLNKQMDQAAQRAGTSGENVTSKSVKIGSTIMVRLISPTDENVKSILSLTKLADLPDGSGLFQITGSDNEDFLKSLGATSISNLTIVGVLAIVDPAGFRKDTSLSMRVYKNVSKDGKPIITNGVVKVALDANVIAKEIPE
jgi:hypothetical protein